MAAAKRTKTRRLARRHRQCEWCTLTREWFAPVSRRAKRGKVASRGGAKQ
jgi:hypothetical protein